VNELVPCRQQSCLDERHQIARFSPRGRVSRCGIRVTIEQQPAKHVVLSVDERLRMMLQNGVDIIINLDLGHRDSNL
jgi:hypothetical protein